MAQVNKRIEDLERDTDQTGENMVVIFMPWNEVVVNSETMTPAEFWERFPDYNQDDGYVVNLSWGSDDDAD